MVRRRTLRRVILVAIGLVITSMGLMAYQVYSAVRMEIVFRGKDPLPERQDPNFVADKSVCFPDTHVGKTREEILNELGSPSLEWIGHYGLPPFPYRLEYTGARTLYYHWPDGTFYASVHEVDGRYVCFSSHWVPNGVILD